MADTARVTVLTIHAEDVAGFERIYKRLEDAYENGDVNSFMADLNRLTFIVETTDHSSLSDIA